MKGDSDIDVEEDWSLPESYFDKAMKLLFKQQKHGKQSQ